jgi:hypothetical protein
MDATLHCPFGSAFFGLSYWDIPLPGTNPSGWNTGSFGSAYWTGSIKADRDELYTFWVACDNRAKIFINNQLVISRAAGGTGPSPGSVEYFEPSAPFAMAGGQWVSIRVELTEDTPGSSPSHIYVEWESPSTARGDIPTSNLRPF